MARHDSALFRAVINGEHSLKGFANRDIRRKLEAAPQFKTWDKDPKKQSSKVSRILRKFHAHGLIAKISRTRRWKVTAYGNRVMATAIYMRDSDFPRAYRSRAA